MSEIIDSKKVIKLIYQYYEMWQKKNIIKVLNEGHDFIEIDLQELETFSYKLVDLLRICPDEMISLFEETVTQFSETNDKKKIKVRFYNLPECDKITLSNIRIEHENRLVKFKGMIKRKSDVMPKIKATYYMCSNPSCSYAENKLKLPQIDEKLKKLKCCPKCKSSIELVGEEKTPFQQLVIEEDLSEGVSNNQPKSKNTELEYDLTSPLMDNNLIVGSKVEVIGFVRSKHADTQRGKNTIGEFFIEANNIITLEDNFDNIIITPEEKEQILGLSKRDDIEELLNNSIAPNIAARKEIKQATLYYAVGGRDKVDKKTQIKQRSHIHLKIIGDAGTGKSQILIRLDNLMPKTSYVSGENSSSAGMVGTVVKDEFTGQWTVEAGSMPMASGGYFLVDEADKIKKEEETKTNQALESGYAVINKAGLKVKLKTDCPCFSVANPKNGMFDKDKDYIKQITSDKTHLTRFDLIFILDGSDSESEQDEVLDRLCGLDSEDFETIADDLLRKYLMYAKKFNPTMNEKLLRKLQNYYKQIFAMAKAKKSIDITYRQFTGLIRMSEARAKLFLRTEVIMEDVVSVMKLMDFTLKKLDLGEITTGVSNTTRSIMESILEYINTMGQCTQEDAILNITAQNKFIPEVKIINVIKSLATSRELTMWEPRKGVVMLK